MDDRIPEVRTGPYPYVSPRARKIIVWLVSSAHVAIILLPGLFLCFLDWLGPETVRVDKVTLVDSAPNDNTAPSKHPGKRPEPNNDDVALPPELSDIPDLPEQQLPAPEPEPAPVPEPSPAPAKRPEPESVQRKTEPVKTPSPQPETTPRKTQNISKWKPIDPKNIRFKPGKTASQSQRSRSNSSASAASAARNLDALAAAIRSGAKPAGGAGGPLGEYDPNANDYYAKVASFLRSRWIDRPLESALGGRRPIVRVYFTIDRNGRILAKKMDSCGIAVMDASVSRLIRSLTVLPAPPNDKITGFYVNMRIED